MQNDEYDCIIIGAGIAGIAAAVELSKAGKSVLILEAKNYIGGRARSFSDTATNEIIDNGQHVLMGCYTSLLSVLEELGAEKLLVRQNALTVNFIDSDGRRDVLKTSRLPGNLGVALGILNLKNISWQSKIHALIFSLRLQIGAIKAENLTAQDFLEKYHQSSEIIERFWQPIILATLNSTPRQAAASLLVEVLKRAFFAGRTASQILIPAVGLSELFAPFSQWLEQHNGKIAVSTSVQSLEIENGNITGVITSKGEKFTAKTIIAAIPPKQLLRIFPTFVQSHPTFAVLHEYQFSPIVSVYLWYDRAWCDVDFAAMLGTTTQWVFNRRKIAPTDKKQQLQFPGHLSLTVSAGDELVDTQPEQVALLCVEELKRAFPKAIHSQLLAWKVIKEKSATFLATPTIESRRIPTETHFPNLFLAGDWTATKLPATLEGAAQSGITAAQCVLCFMKKQEMLVLLK
jgi:squalene-associated FAD-dependent desaturase